MTFHQYNETVSHAGGDDKRAENVMIPHVSHGSISVRRKAGFVILVSRSTLAERKEDVTMSSNQAVVPSSQTSELQTHPLRTDIRLLFQAAMVVFVITVAIGMLNGLHIVQLSADVLLTHVHAGTLGWITLSVFAAGLWLFGEGGEKSTYVRTISILAAIAVPVYVLAFLSGNLIARAVFGFPVLLVIIGYFGWIIARSRQVRLTVARLALLGGIFTLIVGSVIGVILQVQFATSTPVSTGALAAHPATQVVGYLLLIGMAISEWRLMPDTGRLPRAGVIQIAFPFIAGFVLTIGTLLNNLPLEGLNALFEVIGIIIYIVRFTPRILRVSWLTHNTNRFFAFSAIFVVVNVVILTYLIVSTITGIYKSFELVPPWLFFALDHAMFIGVMSNALFGAIQIATQERRSFWPWADDILFWGMNFGMVGFVISLLLDARILERIFTPIMGLSILVALVTYTLRMRRPAEPEAVEVRIGA